jgi:styrene-oxide isomerase
MVGHGILQIFCTLLFGVGYWMKLVRGFEVVPGRIVKFDLPGTEEGWQRAHTGPALNGLMVIGTALAMPFVQLKEQTLKRLGWIVVLDGWSNTLFYFFGNFAPSRALSFGENRHGKSNIFGIIALAPAYLFGVLGLWALGRLGRGALKAEV